MKQGRGAMYVELKATSLSVRPSSPRVVVEFYD
jgi:hypothetical protein